MEQLEGKVVVVTGGASGIGLALAHAFAAEGAKLVLADVEEGPLAEATAAMPATAEVVGVVTDVRDAAAVDALATTTFERFGTAHVVCNNAGVWAGGPTWEDTPERFRWVVEVNLVGVANGIRAFVPRMIDQGEGHVVTTASAAGLMTGPGMPSYFATKHAAVALTEALANDLAFAGITGIGCTIVCPEYVRTRIHEAERNFSGAPTHEGLPGFSAGVEGGTEPGEVAAMVVDAVRADRFWVLPHEASTLAMAQTRWRRISEGRAPFLWD